MGQESVRSVILKVLKLYRKTQKDFTIKDVLRFDSRLKRLTVYYYIQKLLEEETLKTVVDTTGRGNEIVYRFIK